jgi:hypothetical protein
MAVQCDILESFVANRTTRSSTYELYSIALVWRRATAHRCSKRVAIDADADDVAGLLTNE